MLISMILAWLTVCFCLLAALKWVARKTKNKAANRFFHKIHIPFGVLALVTGLIHGIFAGNPGFATLLDFTPAPLLFNLNFGSICFLWVILLGVSYLLRKKLRKYWMPVHRVLTVLMLLFLLLHLIDMGIALPSRLLSAPQAPVLSTPAPEPVAEMPVTVSETPAVSETPVPSVIPEITSAEEAAEAPIPEESMEEEVSIPEEEALETPLVTFSGAVLADGTYTGSADGFKGTITLTVTVESNQVTNITIDSNYDTPNFFQYALSIVDTILGEQSLEVDTVSGATFSSAGILNAVYDALTPAVISGELCITEIDLSSIPRGHGH